MSAATDVVDVCRALAQSGLCAGVDGNVSARLGPHRFLITPSGRRKARLTTDELVEVDSKGSVVAGDLPPSSEMAMHLEIYRRRDDVNAIVHAHPQVATAFSIEAESWRPDLLPELVVVVGAVAFVPYATAGTHDLVDQLVPFVPNHNAFLLAYHGAVTVGSTLESALVRMETLEHSAKVMFYVARLGQTEAHLDKDVTLETNGLVSGISGSEKEN